MGSENELSFIESGAAFTRFASESIALVMGAIFSAVMGVSDLEPDFAYV